MTVPQSLSVTRIGASQTAAAVLVGFGAALVGCVVFLAKLLSRGGLSVPMALGIRFAICSVAVACVVIASRNQRFPVRDEWLGLLCGIGLYALEASLFFAALHHGEAATVTLLFFTYPVFIVLVLLALGHGLPGKLVAGSTLAVVCGAALIAGSSGGLSIQPLGLLLVLGSAAAYTGYVIVIHRALRVSNPLTASMWVTGGVAITLFAVAALFGETGLPANWQEWGELGGMGFGSAAGSVCFFVGLRRIGPVRTSILSTLEPLAVAVLSFVLLAEALRPGTVLGGLLILGGAAVAARANSVPAVQIQ